MNGWLGGEVTLGLAPKELIGGGGGGGGGRPAVLAGGGGGGGGARGAFAGTDFPVRFICRDRHVRGFRSAHQLARIHTEYSDGQDCSRRPH